MNEFDLSILVSLTKIGLISYLVLQWIQSLIIIITQLSYKYWGKNSFFDFSKSEFFGSLLINALCAYAIYSILFISHNLLRLTILAGIVLIFMFIVSLFSEIEEKKRSEKFT